VKRQLAQRGITFEALDNRIRSCADPRQLQALCDGLSAAKIDALFRKWLHRLLEREDGLAWVLPLSGAPLDEGPGNRPETGTVPEGLASLSSRLRRSYLLQPDVAHVEGRNDEEDQELSHASP